jgi:c-di-GMP-binding flagellar brake protein YcgR
MREFSMVLLQDTYYRETSSPASVVILIIIVVIILILVVTNIAKNSIRTSGKGGGTTGARKFSRWALRRAAVVYGLTDEQINLLEWIFKRTEVTDPVLTLSNTTILDRVFKKAYRDIEKTAETEALAEEQKFLLFSIRNTIESQQISNAPISSTRKLPDNIPATLTPPKGENYPVRILSAKGEYLLIECPKSTIGTPIRLGRGTKIYLSFFTKSSQGYRVETRVIDIIDTPRGPALQVAHSEQVKMLPNRRYKRVQSHLSCYFSFVQVEQRQVGRKIEKQTFVDPRRSLGTIIDISAGGCAIKSTTTIPAGSYLKIEFEDSDGKSLAALGRIVRTNKSGVIGGIMHIQFVKIPKKTFNTINAMVYEYDQQ